MQRIIFISILFLTSCRGYHGACDEVGCAYIDSVKATLLARELTDEDGEVVVIENTLCCGNHPGHEGEGAAYKEAQDVVDCSDYYQDLIELEENQ